ncbi:RING finger protein 151-like [Gigantopelta aegis]|uniref:RING finger protein 151-like n=1 Tax=Gigantopelta aegis TaxID=1735272 RepID=UPI001B88BB3E|nr:RING finger protein 151-like [Gigantopelta aegis]XP_041376155.1 RING finger protein 151-like [Gigantopelta aegis]XP_041376156.1 RING finger protein 151-like [Gigantopelta aegis]XP_041376157.1 RING finger protein 151-like [Gigantopelta aegis]
MGYDIDRFTSTINEGLLCCICRDVLQAPLQAPCEHAFCGPCIQSWLVNECSCPEDRKPLFRSDLKPLFRYMRNDLQRLSIRCKNFRLGCGHIGSLEHEASHSVECSYELISCRNVGCHKSVPRGAMEEHLESCETGTKECAKGCGLRLSSADVKEHSCIAELKSSIEILRAEMICKLDDQRREMEVRLDMQRGHMVQREAAMQSSLQELRTELSKINQKVKLLMDLELQRRQDLERMQIERTELLGVLERIEKEQEASNRQPKCRHCSQNVTREEKETTI